MRDPNIDDLLEQSLSDDPPSPVFRERVLHDSMEAFLHVRQRRTCRQWIAVHVAAILLIAVSFLLGRWSGRVGGGSPVVGPAIVDRTTEEVMVPAELVAWVEAANLFRQLDMTDRMARAVNRAGNLLPGDLVTMVNPTESAFINVDQGTNDGQLTRVDWIERWGAVPSGECINRIMAQSLGD